ncbi:Histidine-specific methyltransferase EgtD [Stieleria neptunia]|uniref:Histidine-specific methyltransferase EgtD n=1 Tax=Stieleria neptunia TaxID=2527979 RepID=A0A518HW14_9BACT|nr:L-histidine N(alpha)-methyltransferase [Stieleria neptunia]QDV45046.1 Histidine-specific methyltransferase EgtD [Stieleria neptunia]
MLNTAPTKAAPRSIAFQHDVMEGLGQVPKRLPCKYFYDKRGSALFDEICDLDEYYLTRTEQAIMNRYASEMGTQIDSGAMLVEYGSGSSIKTRILLDHLIDPVAYVPVDISHRHLQRVAERLRVDYPHLEILPVTADFTRPFSLPHSREPATHCAVYFPGSTIGNFEPAEAERLLRSISERCGSGGGLLIGIDLVKDVETLERAYNDDAGVTAAFNLNLLRRIRDELDADIDVQAFEHVAFYNHQASRIEIYIRSLKQQTIRIGETSFELDAGELIHTEYSHKYTIEGFSALAARAGLELHRSWTDDERLFAVLHLVVAGVGSQQNAP